VMTDSKQDTRNKMPANVQYTNWRFDTSNSTISDPKERSRDVRGGRLRSTRRATKQSQRVQFSTCLRLFFGELRRDFFALTGGRAKVR
jgi:hypothetical protein